LGEKWQYVAGMFTYVHMARSVGHVTYTESHDTRIIVRVLLVGFKVVNGDCSMAEKCACRFVQCSIDGPVIVLGLRVIWSFTSRWKH